MLFELLAITIVLTASIKMMLRKIRAMEAKQWQGEVDVESGVYYFMRCGQNTWPITSNSRITGLRITEVTPGFLPNITLPENIYYRLSDITARGDLFATFQNPLYTKHGHIPFIIQSEKKVIRGQIIPHSSNTGMICHTIIPEYIRPTALTKQEQMQLHR